MQQVSTKFDAPAFPAHVTLLGNAPKVGSVEDRVQGRAGCPMVSYLEAMGPLPLLSKLKKMVDPDLLDF